MIGVGDVGLFGGQRWKERDRGARSQGLSSSNAPSAGMALPGASAPTPPTEHFPPPHPPTHPTHPHTWAAGLAGPSVFTSSP